VSSVTTQTPFAFASGAEPGQVIFRFSDSDAIDRYVYDLRKMRLWHDWWFVGARAAFEYVIRRDETGQWLQQLHAWQESTAEPLSDPMLLGQGQWHAAAVLLKETAAHEIHRKMTQWHPVPERHVADLEKAYREVTCPPLPSTYCASPRQRFEYSIGVDPNNELCGLSSL
jgi:hypothetical protein